MKKVLYLSFLSLVLFACSEPDHLNTDSELLQDSYKQSKSVLETDVIVPLDSTNFPKAPPKIQALMATDIWSTLYELNGIDFFIQSKNSYFGKNTFQSYGKGQEIKLESFSSTNPAQLFHLVFLPASSGIPYLIYSSKENAPIGAGSYPSTPNDYVLYTQNAGSSSLFGFSWDFYLNNDENAFYIENQDLIGSGSGGPWDIFYYGLRIFNGNIEFAKLSNSTAQEFVFIPNDIFDVIDVQASLDGAQILYSVPTTVKSGDVVNNTSTTMPFTLTFNETINTTSNFKETTGIKTDHSGNVSVGFKFWKIELLSGGYSFTTSKTVTTEYGSSVSKSNSFTETFNITVPPNRRVEYEYIAMEHLVNLPYDAEMLGQNTAKTLNIKGIYTGVEYSSTRLEVTEYPAGSGLTSLSADTPIRKYTLYPDEQQQQ